MWTRGKDKNAPGKFAYELFTNGALTERVGGFDTAQAADRAAEVAQRKALRDEVLGGVKSTITLDELAAELEGF